jgi:4'-phosphopantetheinyl transferase
MNSDVAVRSGSLLRIRWPAHRGAVEPLGETVHVWAAALDVAPERRASLGALLSSDERHRAGRYRTDELIARFTTGRGILREILGAYLDVPPRDMRFRYDEHGKPLLAPDAHPNAPSFNVSHAGGLALYALARRGRLGVDVELISPFPDMLRLSGHFFSAGERRSLESVASLELADAFFSIWTRKEAYLKAHGTGLLAPLDRFEVSAGRREPAALLQVADDPGARQRWSLVHLEPADTFIGAVALEAPRADVLCRHWIGKAD